jgi:hypothetical protein
LNHGFSTKNARAGEVITGRIMQDVPLPNAGKIPEGAKNRGGRFYRFHLLEIVAAREFPSDSITLKFITGGFR